MKDMDKKQPSPDSQGAPSASPASSCWASSTLIGGTMPRRQYWIIALRPGLCAVRKGPFTDRIDVQAMLRSLYATHPCWRCAVIDGVDEFNYCSGREWLNTFGDRRRKKLPPETAPNARVSGLSAGMTCYACHRKDLK